MIKINYLLEEKIEKKITFLYKKADTITDSILNQTYKYQDYLIFSAVETIDADEILLKIKDIPKIDTLITVGIGGSYLGLNACYSFLKSIKHSNINLIMTGYNTNDETYQELLNSIKDKNYAINFISKSGNTLEINLMYNLLKEKIMKDFPKDYQKRIVVTTSQNDSFLYNEVLKNNFLHFNIPSCLSGRYSVLSNVALVPLAILGYDIKKIIEGAILFKKDFFNKNAKDNYLLKYALARYILNMQNKVIELTPSFSNKSYNIMLWHQQLFSESEGKKENGILPFPIMFSRDLHSLGQFIQEGRLNFFETFLFEEKEKEAASLPLENIYLSMKDYNPKKLNYIEDIIFKSSIIAHKKRNINIITISYNPHNETSLGYLLHFFLFSCLYSATLLNINPFNQPGVELYKENITVLLENKKI